MASPIPLPKEGEPVDQLWRIVAELVKAMNAFLQMEISPQTAGSIKYADGNVKLVFNTEQCQG